MSLAGGIIVGIVVILIWEIGKYLYNKKNE